VKGLSCDLLLTPHPGASGWDYTDAIQSTRIDCVDYAKKAEQTLREQRKAQQAD
jgi:metallo-beta-lactamase class B